MFYRYTVVATASILVTMGMTCQASAQGASPTAPTAQTPAPEDQAKGDVEKVVVTARRRREPLADVPGAATVIDSQQVDNRGGATSGEQIFGGQPSVNFFSTSSPVNSEASIRGSSTSRGTNADPSIGLYRNGIYIGGGRLSGRNFSRLDLFDIGRIEILRGTQGALYGRNAVGGTVNVISQQPLFETSGLLDVRVGLDPEGGQVRGVFNTALNETFAVRVGGEYVDQKDGFFYNPANDVYFDQEYGHSWRGQIRMRKERLDVNLLVEHQQMTLPAVRYRVVIAPTPPRFPLGYVQEPFSYPWNFEPLAKQQINGAILTVNYHFDWADLVSTSFVRKRKSYLQLDLDAIDAATLADLQARGIVVGNVDINSHQTLSDLTTSWVQEIHLSGALLDDRLDWLLGAEYLTQLGDAGQQNLRTPTTANPSPGVSAPLQVDYESAAAYASLEYSLTAELKVSGEARYTSDSRALMARRFDLRTGLPTGGAAFNIDAQDAPENISYNLITAYRLAPEILAYAKMGTSYRAGGFNTNLGDPRQPVPIPAAFDDETATVYEVGLKGQVTPYLYFAGAGYRSYSDNLIVQADNGCFSSNPVCPIVPTSFLTNAGQAQVWGMEAEAVFRAAVAGGLMRLSVSGSRQGGEVVDGLFAGATLPQIPKWLAGVEIFYSRPFIGETELFGNAQYNARFGGEQELQKPSPPLEDFQTINLRGGIRFDNGLGTMEFSGFVNNATDQVYGVFGGPTTQRLSTPRTYGLQVRQRF